VADRLDWRMIEILRKDIEKQKSEEEKKQESSSDDD
jgi:hypothetical protein